MRKETRTSWLVRAIEDQLLKDGAILPRPADSDHIIPVVTK
jgi:hypothetical protein